MSSKKPILSKQNRLSARTPHTAASGGRAAYDGMWLVDIPGGKVHLLGDFPLTETRLQHLYKKEPLHRQALTQTQQQGMYHYEWVQSGRPDTLWQTTCIALTNRQGTVSQMLALSRDISSVVPARGTTGLRDWSAPKTFAQLLLAARENEKKSISKALHDEIGSAAVILTALLSLVKGDIIKGKKQQALKDIANLDTQIKNYVENIKNIVVSLRPPTLDNQGGLRGAVQDLLDNIQNLHHIPCSFSYAPALHKVVVSDNVRTLLFRIVQEALTNAIKHARAKHLAVSVSVKQQNILLSVQDDGIGFNVKQQRSLQQVGLQAMKESVELLGGTISIKSAVGKGTRICVSCPRIIYGGK